MNKQIKNDITCSFVLDQSFPKVEIYEGSDEYTFEDVQSMLLEQGIELSIIPSKYGEPNTLLLKFHHKEYNRAKTRYAGNQRKYAYKDDSQNIYKVYKYADILYFRYCEHMKWTEIAEHIGFSEATFFRHKKEMEISHRYKKFLRHFEPEKANSLKYFESFEELNTSF